VEGFRVCGSVTQDWSLAFAYFFCFLPSTQRQRENIDLSLLAPHGPVESSKDILVLLWLSNSVCQDLGSHLLHHTPDSFIVA